MLHIHQFFTKLLGCVAVEHNIPLPIASFAHHLRSETAEPNLRIVFVHIPAGSTKDKIQIGYVNATTNITTGEVMKAVWHYIVGSLGVAVSYVRPGLSQLRFTAKLGWHLNNVSRTWRLR